MLRVILNVIQTIWNTFKKWSVLSITYILKKSLNILITFKNWSVRSITYIFKKSWTLITVKNYLLPNKDKPSGLENTANTSYMNSTIQMLASSNKLIGQFENISAPNTTLRILIDLLHAVNNNKSDVASIKRNSLVEHMHWNESQDPYDFQCAVINDVKPETIEEKSMPLKITIAYKYEGVPKENKSQIHLGLSLGLCGCYAVYPGVKLEDLIDNYLSPKIIDEDGNKTVQNYFYEKTPEILLLHIQANKWNQDSRKMIKTKYYIQNYENIELKLTVAQDLYKKTNSELVNYKLCGFIHHVEDSSYVSYRKLKGNWFFVDNDKVKKWDFDSDICPYILLYEKDDKFEHRI